MEINKNSVDLYTEINKVAKALFRENSCEDVNDWVKVIQNEFSGFLDSEKLVNLISKSEEPPEKIIATLCNKSEECREDIKEMCTTLKEQMKGCVEWLQLCQDSDLTLIQFILTLIPILRSFETTLNNLGDIILSTGYNTENLNLTGVDLIFLRQVFLSSGEKNLESFDRIKEHINPAVESSSEPADENRPLDAGNLDSKRLQNYMDKFLKGAVDWSVFNSMVKDMNKNGIETTFDKEFINVPSFAKLSNEYIQNVVPIKIMNPYSMKTNIPCKANKFAVKNSEIISKECEGGAAGKDVQVTEIAQIPVISQVEEESSIEEAFMNRPVPLSWVSQYSMQRRVNPNIQMQVKNLNTEVQQKAEKMLTTSDQNVIVENLKDEELYKQFGRWNTYIGKNTGLEQFKYNNDATGGGSFLNNDAIQVFDENLQRFYMRHEAEKMRADESHADGISQNYNTAPHVFDSGYCSSLSNNHIATVNPIYSLENSLFEKSCNVLYKDVNTPSAPSYVYGGAQPMAKNSACVYGGCASNGCFPGSVEKPYVLYQQPTQRVYSDLYNQYQAVYPNYSAESLELSNQGQPCTVVSGDHGYPLDIQDPEDAYQATSCVNNQCSAAVFDKKQVKKPMGWAAHLLATCINHNNLTYDVNNQSSAVQAAAPSVNQVIFPKDSAASYYNMPSNIPPVNTHVADSAAYISSNHVAYPRNGFTQISGDQINARAKRIPVNKIFTRNNSRNRNLSRNRNATLNQQVDYQNMIYETSNAQPDSGLPSSYINRELSVIENQPSTSHIHAPSSAAAYNKFAYSLYKSKIPQSQNQFQSGALSSYSSSSALNLNFPKAFLPNDYSQYLKKTLISDKAKNLANALYKNELTVV